MKAKKGKKGGAMKKPPKPATPTGQRRASRQDGRTPNVNANNDGDTFLTDLFQGNKRKSSSKPGG